MIDAEEMIQLTTCFQHLNLKISSKYLLSSSVTSYLYSSSKNADDIYPVVPRNVRARVLLESIVLMPYA